MEKNGQTAQCRFQSTLTKCFNQCFKRLRNTSRATCEQNVGLIFSVKQPVSSHQSFRMSSQWHLQIPGAGSSWLRTTPAGWNYQTLSNMSQLKHVSAHSVKTSPHSCFKTLWSIHIFHQFSTATAATATSILSASVATLLTDVFHVDHVTGKRPRFCLCASRSDGNSHLCEIGWNDYFCVYQITPDHTHS